MHKLCTKFPISVQHSLNVKTFTGIGWERIGQASPLRVCVCVYTFFFHQSHQNFLITPLLLLGKVEERLPTLSDAHQG